jgi:hypothetical protein
VRICTKSRRANVLITIFMNMFPWTILLLSYIEKLGGDKIIYLKKEGLESISDKLNPFWRDILLNLSELLPPKDEEENNIINIFWLDFNIQSETRCACGGHVC